MNDFMLDCQNRSSSNGKDHTDLLAVMLLVWEDFCRRKLYNYLEKLLVL